MRAPVPTGLLVAFRRIPAVRPWCAAALAVGLVGACGSSGANGGSGGSAGAAGAAAAGGIGGGAGSGGAAGDASSSHDAGGDVASDAATDGPVCNLPPPNPADCQPGDNTLYCTSHSKSCPGERYDCKNGTWTKADLDAACKMLGNDFAYGCVLDQSVGGVLLVCGNNCSSADGGCD